MKFGIVTLFPEMFSAVTDYGVTGRAVKSGLMQLDCINPRDFTQDVHRTVDDRPYGGGPGMLMIPGPLIEAINSAKATCLAACDKESAVKVVYLSPQGKTFDQQAAKRFANEDALVLVAGRYEGIDERVIQSVVDEEWSIGDYVLSGGELPAMTMIDAITRLLPGVLGHQDSAEEDSFTDGLLDCPHYTRPERFRDSGVPKVLLSGNHQAIKEWRLKQSLGRTWERRPELLESKDLDNKQQALLDAYKKEALLKR
ncbi:tRNA (guanosine(37)-N1)-methyltransferase TrmD [Gammaproteobacteria bacterium 45_16_T64]|nr:tRNA (guanosine(37)-N1)-methyltransferase TrmD [Gammaproteobacteria bacterium 45_16_T64]